MLIFCDFIQVYVFTTNHHLNVFVLHLFVVKNDLSPSEDGCPMCAAHT